MYNYWGLRSSVFSLVSANFSSFPFSSGPAIPFLLFHFERVYLSQFFSPSPPSLVTAIVVSSCLFHFASSLLATLAPADPIRYLAWTRVSGPRRALRSIAEEMGAMEMSDGVLQQRV
ncbi:uncharacterized protein EI97DRAFT_252308 [Westerdykella ornata]|uniref:Uncharacterized protein n=1 Tax=Westerdykella ornata TaxID=318751 RepID=A0A6A6JR94_WESOR|nr:uncharacterized protein EI97DRAFT_252308 [Westerdykella ornata]KAF2278398.1 hypothetical protein EI97DRAFT_252308 [Westerdykella ornata]